MSSLAQEESRSISENVTWGHRKRFADGKVMVPFASLLGYKKGEDGTLVIDETQAPIVRRIYADFLTGHSPKTIAHTLTEAGIPTPRNKRVWATSTVRSILSNEKYKGDALLQKTFTTDFLTKTVKKNEGQVAQYYVSGNHEPIITPATWDFVQTELARRAQPGSSHAHPFASRIKCGQCGGWYGRKAWHSGTKYARHIWRCNHKYEPPATGCTTPHISEQQIRDAFTTAIATLAPPPSKEVLTAIIAENCDTTSLEAELKQVALNRDGLLTRLNDLIAVNATTAQDQDAYQQRFTTLEAEYRQHADQHAQLTKQIRDAQQRREHIERIHAYRTTHPILVYSDDAWNTLIDHATIHNNGSIEFTLNDGTTHTA